MAKKCKLNFAIIGAGNISREHISALQKIDDAKVVYLYGRDESKLKGMETEFNIPWTTNYQDILDNREIDIVDIVLPSGLHAEFGIKAARASKHVIVEKPIDVTLDKAKALIAACKEQAVILAVISQMRFSDGMQKIYDYMATGKFGKIIQADAYVKWYRPQAYYESGAWRGTAELDGGGAFINQGIHFIDLLLSVMGAVKRVTATVRNTIHDVEVEDHGMAMIEFENGAQGIVQASTALYPGLPARLEIHGTKGTVIYENDDISFQQFEGEQPYSALNNDKGGAANPLMVNEDLFIREFEDIISAINGNHPPRISGAEALRSLRLVLAIYESSNSGKTVIL